VLTWAVGSTTSGADVGTVGVSHRRRRRLPAPLARVLVDPGGYEVAGPPRRVTTYDPIDGPPD
jgi:hypothetical protein